MTPSSDAEIKVTDSGTEELFFSVAEAQAADISRAVEAAREAFDAGPWLRLTHAERAGIVRAIGAELGRRSDDIGQIWPRESGVLHAIAQFGGAGAIIPWNAPMALISNKVAPALLAGCTVILKPSPEAPGEGYPIAEAAEAVGLPAGVPQRGDRRPEGLRAAGPRSAGGQDHLHRGSTTAGRRIASICGDRIARCTLELGGKSAAVILNDADLASAAQARSQAECLLSGQVCASLTRIVVSRSRQDELVDALAASFSQVRVGNPFEPASQMGPLAARHLRDRVEGYIAKGLADGAKLATGSGRPDGLDRGWYLVPTARYQGTEL